MVAAAVLAIRIGLVAEEEAYLPMEEHTQIATEAVGMEPVEVPFSMAGVVEHLFKTVSSKAVSVVAEAAPSAVAAVEATPAVEEAPGQGILPQIMDTVVAAVALTILEVTKAIAQAVTVEMELSSSTSSSHLKC